MSTIAEDLMEELQAAPESVLKERAAGRESLLPHRLVTAHESCIRRVVVRLSVPKLNEVREQVCAVIREN